MFTGWQAFHVENDLHATALRGDRSRTNVRTVRVFDLDARGSLGKGDRAGGQRLLRTRPLFWPMPCVSMTKDAPRSTRSCWQAWMARPILTRRVRGTLKSNAGIEAGTIQLEPWEQVRQRIEKDILGR